MNKIDQAREWAERRRNISDSQLNAGVKAAAELIKSLPDHWVDVEKLKAIIADMDHCLKMETTSDFSKGVDNATTSWRDALEALIAPKLPTLADMTQEEREACRWMQCRVTGIAGTPVLSKVGNGSSLVLTSSGDNLTSPNDRIAPLQGEPKLKWPGSGSDDIASATGGVLTTQDVVDECRAVRKERALPRPEDVPDPHPGEAWLVNTREGEQREALKAGNRWYVKDGDDVEEWVEEALTPISRLVLEPPALPKGMRLADNETLGRIVVSQRTDEDGDYAFFESIPGGIAGASWGYVHKSELTFLGGEK